MRDHRFTAVGGVGALAVLLALVVAFSADLLAGPRAARAQDAGWQPVTVLYTSDVKGHIDPCG